MTFSLTVCAGTQISCTRRALSVCSYNSPMIRVGIIGTGLIAKEHAQAIAMVREAISLVTAADVDLARLDGFCTSFHVPRRYGAAHELIMDRDVDLVVITTPPAAHEELVVAALEK